MAQKTPQVAEPALIKTALAFAGTSKEFIYFAGTNNAFRTASFLLSLQRRGNDAAESPPAATVTSLKAVVSTTARYLWAVENHGLKWTKALVCAAAVSENGAEILQIGLESGQLRRYKPWGTDGSLLVGALQWVQGGGFSWADADVDLCGAAASHGRIKTLRWARANGCPWGDTCCRAAAGGHTEVLEFARADGCPEDGPRICSAAAGAGRLETLLWLREESRQYDWDEETTRAAAASGHLAVLQAARAGDCPWGPRCCSAAAGGGFLEVLRWARDNGCPWDNDTCSQAAGGGHLEVLQWARANGCGWDWKTCIFAHPDCPQLIEWVHANGCPCHHTVTV